jgi:hypothetical protein
LTGNPRRSKVRNMPRVGGRIDVRPTVKLAKPLLIVLLLGLTGCASVRAPGLAGGSWSGHDGSRLTAQLRYTSDQLPEGWLHKTYEGDASGSFAYRKQSGSYDYSERGYFVVDPEWRKDRSYVGLLKPGGVFCVANPEQQSSEEEDTDAETRTITFWTVYDYCAQLRSP